MSEKKPLEWYADVLRNKHRECLNFAQYNSGITRDQIIHNRAYLTGAITALMVCGQMDKDTWDEELDALYEMFNWKELCKENERILNGN